jgi:parvulin-like peptidyl-prolyl isomerase
MRRILISVIVISSFFFCSKKEEVFKLEKGTAAYQLGLELMNKLPVFNPDTIIILVVTDKFKFSNAEMIKHISDKFPARINQLKAMNTDELKRLIPQIAHDMALNKLLLLTAKQKGIKIADKSIDSLLNEQYKRAGGEEQFLQKIQNSGMDLASVKKDIQDFLTIQDLFKKYVYTDQEISEDEIQRMYNEDVTATVRHILLITKDKAESEKIEIRKKIEKILQLAKKGEDFAELAKKYSEDPGSKAKGGLYENFPKGYMVKPFEEAAFSVPIGEISDIIETVYGYHILKVIDRKKESRPLAEFRSQLIEKRKRENKDKLQQNYLDKLKQESGFQVIQL